MAEKSTGSQFHVVLAGIKLKPDVEDRINMRIRQVVAEELASMDFKGDLLIAANKKFPSNSEFPGGTRGMYATLADLER